LIAGLDISSSKIGMSVLSPDRHIQFLEVLKLSSKQSLIERALIFKAFCQERLLPLAPTKIIVESPLINVSGGFGRAQTTAMLIKFNGICCFAVREVFGFEPEEVNVNHVRSVLGIKIVRHLLPKQKKQVVIDWAVRQFAGDPKIVLLTEKTKFGNAALGVDDMADALAIAAYGARK
jgi:hypothetical protein